MHKNAIELKSVSKYYKLYESPRDRLKEALDPRDKSYHKKFFAVKNVDLCIPKGEIIGILGVNGSGKSTLLKLIAHVLTPSSGDIQVNGRISALLELGAGFNPNFTGLENVHFYGSIMGLSRGEVEEKLDGILSFADIGEFVNQPLKTYSSGMKARLGFAIATEVDSEILIIDEVLAVGDAAFKRKCFARIEYLLGEGKTVLIVSHNKNSIASLCTRGIVLHKGSLVVDGYVNKTIKTPI
jgi:lipopolysaccharide transport system ATP-binding protein